MRTLPAPALRRLAAAAIAASLATALPERAHAGECRDLGALRVAFGTLVGLAAVTVTSFVAPGVAASEDESLHYPAGVGISFLAGAGGLASGAFISAKSACDEGLWLPGVMGGVSSLGSTIIWGVAASEPRR